MGEPIPSNVGISIAESIGNRGERGELKHQYPQEKKTIVIPKVVASEMGGA